MVYIETTAFPEYNLIMEMPYQCSLMAFKDIKRKVRLQFLMGIGSGKNRSSGVV